EINQIIERYTQQQFPITYVNKGKERLQTPAGTPKQIQSLIERKPNNNNSINCLANTFTTIKQEETKAVITYLRCFHRNLHQIQAIQADYFTVPQILNQFIHGLCSSILQCICQMHLADLQTTITNARDFETAELKTNHAQAINLVMNESSELDSKLKQFSDFINQKLEEYLANNQWPQETHICHYCVSNSELPTQFSTISTELSANDTTANISTIHISTFSLLTTATSNISTTTATNNLLDICSSNTTIKLSSNNIKKL
ncbi:hypothetical protein G9A89_011124, partial [Geosiphon pyriformis]